MAPLEGFLEEVPLSIGGERAVAEQAVCGALRAPVFRGHNAVSGRGRLASGTVPYQSLLPG